MNKIMKYIAHTVPDSLYVRIKYFYHFHSWPDLSNPKTFNEKIQWLKLHDRRSEYTLMVDKFEAKRYVEKIVGSEYIIPTYGVWDNYEDIHFDKLPDQFVIKCTHDCGGQSICRSKKTFDYRAAKVKIESSLKNNYYWQEREWPYKNVKPRVLIEKYLEESSSEGASVKGLTDYKFFCFSGTPQLLYISRGLENHATAEISFFDLEGKRLLFARSDYKPFSIDVKLPSNYKEMLETAEKIAKAVNNQFVRVDLYSVNNHVYFSEITLHPCGGLLPFCPESADYEVGNYLKLEI